MKTRAAKDVSHAQHTHRALELRLEKFGEKRPSCEREVSHEDLAKLDDSIRSRLVAGVQAERKRSLRKFLVGLLVPQRANFGALLVKPKFALIA